MSDFRRRYTARDGQYEIWSDGHKLGLVERFGPPGTRGARWRYSLDGKAWGTGPYDIGYRTITIAVNALVEERRQRGQSQERDNDQQGQDVQLAGRDVRQRDHHHRRRRAKARTQAVG